VSKLVERCTYPLTGLARVKRVYIELTTFACTHYGLQLIDNVGGLGHAELEILVGLPNLPAA
jgi:3-oxoadipate CoA-transferase beta subunit